MTDWGDGSTPQREAFMNGEADAWYRRNPISESSSPPAVDLQIARHLGELDSVLEIGCSDGRRLTTLASMVPGLDRLAGIDPSEAAITAGQTRWPSLDLRVGSAEAIPFDEPFDVVILGFFLYLCDRALLPRVVAEVDRVLADNGTLAIVDFDPPTPRRRAYRHRAGLWSYKMDYSAPFVVYPSYSCAEKFSFSHDSDTWAEDESERLALYVLKKRVEGGYAVEDDLRT
jgi:ubiquinone/menaquinone biosynthesis C-methylase UbiE